MLQVGDTLQLEATPCLRHYHARFLRPIKVGRAIDDEQALVRELIAIQDRALAAVGPGAPPAVPDRLYREGVLAADAVAKYPNKIFYSVGLLLVPNSGEFFEAAPGCEWRFEVGMAFHSYLIVRGFAMTETVLITPQGYERMTTYPRQLIVS